MSYLICIKNFENIPGSLYKIAENETDLNNLNIDINNFKIIEISQNDFNSLKLQDKFFVSYDNNNIATYSESKDPCYSSINSLKNDISSTINTINMFLDNNKNHVDYSKFNSYKTQLSNIDINNYPLTKSIPEYFNDLGQTSLNVLQIP